MRQTHHWAALVFLGAISLHMLRVFFTGAFRWPRQMNWLVGCTLLTIAVFSGFTGYSMVDDLLSGTGLVIGYSVLLSLPVLGPWLAFLLFGGPVPNSEIIPRLYAIHVMIIPGLLALLVTIHLAIVWRQKHTNSPVRNKQTTRSLALVLANLCHQSNRLRADRVRHHCRAGRFRRDQPGLAVGTI